MYDWMGRDIHYLRLSLTQRCNLRCVYCREESDVCESGQELTLEQVTELMQAFVAVGITRVRLTGGEPLMRRDLEKIVQRVASFPQVQDLSMTTNAQGLADRISGLHSLGLQRVNISLDSLNAQRYRDMTRGGDFQQVWKGIEAALKQGMQVKLNTVLIRGQNDREVDDFIRLAEQYPISVRFIEQMPFGAPTRAGQRILNRDILTRHPELYPVEPYHVSQPSQDYCADGFAGRVGFISPISHQFCSECNRIRLTSEGKLRLCLGHEAEIDVRPFLNGDTKRLKAVIRDAIYHKPQAHAFASVCPSHTMNQIGG